MEFQATVPGQRIELQSFQSVCHNATLPNWQEIGDAFGDYAAVEAAVDMMIMASLPFLVLVSKVPQLAGGAKQRLPASEPCYVSWRCKTMESKPLQDETRSPPRGSRVGIGIRLLGAKLA